MGAVTETAGPYATAPTLAEFNAGLGVESWAARTRCAACTSTAIDRFSRIRQIHYDRCAECGFVFANPMPTDAVLADFYNSAFYNNYRVLEEQTIAAEPYFSVSAYRDLRELATWIEADRAAAILDYGCGPGSFLALLRDEFGFANVEGLELNLHSAEVARRCYGLELAPDVGALHQQSYDVIVLFETIEHLSDPDEVVATCARLLSPCGVLFVTTPSVRNIPARRFPSHCVHYTGPSHVSLFTEQALERLLSRHGLRIRRLETDANTEVLGSYLARPFYDLDFSSPRGAGDADDRLYRPTALGRALKLQPARTPGPLLGQAAKLDTFAAKALRKLFGRAYSDHLYAMAGRA
ncbi:class I SAM-dependent methyltransferase [Phenylobacterium sp. LjRoot219]|uniref:class I SAM-dependent methyltransferase n=1 Tax=Phenylobacterium sp. LjRoot219 TaxID=3342283 RepID=UPI003ECDCE6D